MEAFREIIEMPGLPVKAQISRSVGREPITAHPHWHDAVELIYVVRGRAVQQIDENLFPVTAHDLIVIWSNQVHSTYSAQGEPCEMKVLQLGRGDIADFVTSLHFTGPITTQNPLYAQVYRLVLLLTEELAGQDAAYQYVVKSAVYQLYALILRNLSCLPVRVDPVNHNKDIIVRIFEYIDHNYRFPIPLPTIARAVHLSVAQFMRVFKAATGVTFKYYLNRYRVERSLLHLMRGETVTQTAAECGFETVNTYIRLFKQHKHCTPAQYAKRAGGAASQKIKVVS